VTTLGYNPSDMDFTAISNKAEARISGALGVPAIVAGLSAGMDSSTYNNLANLKKSAFEECLCPLWENFETILDEQLLIDFETAPNIETEFKTTHIRALQENETERQDRERKNLAEGGITLNEFREHVGQEPIPEGDIYYLPNKLSPVSAKVLAEMAAEKPQPKPAPTAPNDPNDPNDPAEPPKGLKKKSIEFEGLTLARDPLEHEKYCLKGMSAAFDIGRDSIKSALLTLREELIVEAVKELGELEPENYHKLILDGTDATKARVVELIYQSYRKGRELVADERAYQLRIAGKSFKADGESFGERLAKLASLTISRIINEVQTRATAIAAQLAALFGEAPDAETLQAALDDTSTGYVSNIASGAANVALAGGRADEAKDNEVARVYYSAILDLNTCGPCENDDGKEAERAEDLPDVPNVLCEGGDKCRCILIYVFATEV
jgi:hypothetical protein